MAISEADKIKRAEEIYYRRKYNKNYPKSNKKSFVSWLFGNIVYISIIIIFVVSFNNRDYILSKEFNSDIDRILNQQININNIITTIYDKYSNEKSRNSIEKNSDSSIEIDIKKDSDEETIKEENLSKVNIQKISFVKDSDTTPEKYIKSNIKFVPILKRNYGVTSRFGYRKSKNKNVQGYHTGIDIAAKKGENIYSAIDGEVIVVSNQGNYGKHLCIQSKADKKVTVLYAHCSKIIVRKGTKVKRGDKIAKVGSTGNSTGPHLHFEIRYKNKSLNPEKILEF